MDNTRSYDFSDLIVSLQKDQTRVVLEGSEAISFYKNYMIEESVPISDDCTITSDIRARYNISRYNNCYYA